MDVKQMYEQALTLASNVVDQTTTDDFDQPTPDTEWTVRDLLNHMMYELAWSADIMHGKTIAEVGSIYEGNLIADDFQTRWHRFAEAALGALDDMELTDVAHLSYGDVAMEQYLWQNGSDLAVHAWDLGEAIAQPVRFDQGLCEALYTYAETRKAAIADSGLFGEQLEVPEDAELQTKLLSLYGRQA